MTEHNPHMIAHILRKDYPEVATAIHERISVSLPKDRLTDFEYIPQIIAKYEAIKGLRKVCWKNNLSLRNRSITKMRVELIAVIFIFYQPEKVIGLTGLNAKIGLVQAIAIELKCPRATISQALRAAVADFKNYKIFRQNVHEISMIIKTELKLFLT